MRLLELKLKAFGPFTNRTLDFGGESGAGLHLVLGANEAGKSTALRGLRAVLFGLPDDRDAHSHSKDTVRVGLRLRTAEGVEMEVERRRGKSAKRLILVGTEKPVGGEEWERIRQVESAEVFEQMFGLDYERLVAGGRKIAAFEGEVGQALLAAAGDTGMLVKKLQEMEEAAEDLYSARATSSKLRKALAACHAANAMFRSERFTSVSFQQAMAKKERLLAALQKVGLDRVAAVTELTRLQRLQTAGPHVRRLVEDERALAALGEVCRLVPDFAGRYEAVVNGLRGARAKRDEAVTELERLERELALVPRNERLAGLLDEIHSLKEETGRIVASREHLPKRVAERNTLAAERGRLCAELGVEQATVPTVPVAQRAQLESQSETYVRLVAKRDEVPRRVAGLEAQLREAVTTLQGLPEVQDTTLLADRVAEAKGKKEPEEKLKKLRGVREATAAQLERDLGGLRFGSWSGEQLESLRVPLVASVRAFGERFGEQAARLRLVSESCERLQGEVEKQQERLAQLERQKAIPTEAELAEARERRERGWAAVRESWLEKVEKGPAALAFGEGANGAGLPEAYEGAVRVADDVADALRREATRVAEKASAMEGLQQARRRLADELRKRESQVEAGTGLAGDWTALWRETGIQPGTALEMQEWLEERLALVNRVRDLRRLEEQISEVEAEVAELRAALGEVVGLEPAGAQLLTLGELVRRADALVREARELAQRRSELNSRERQLRVGLEEARAEQATNEAALAAWNREWAAALAGLPVGGNAEPAAVRAVLGVLEQIRVTTGRIEDLDHRIVTMGEEVAAFEGAVAQLLSRAGVAMEAGSDGARKLQRLQELATAAVQAETKVAGIAESLERERGRREVASAQAARYERTLGELRVEARVADEALIPEVMRVSREASGLAERIEGHRKALADSCGGLELETMLDQVLATDADGLPGEVSRVAEAVESLQAEKERLTRELDEVEREFRLREGAEALRAAAVEKESAAARVEALAEEYLELRLGAKLLGKAMELYREKHQHPVLKRAAEFFALLTCGAFRGLAIDDEGSRRVLKGERASGERLAVEGMSDGTRDQLFLALRLAYVEKHCEGSAACPVVLDDVLMAFDDARARATLRALAELGTKTQVIVFTHHSHHVALAEAALAAGDFRVHQLQGGVAAMQAA